MSVWLAVALGGALGSAARHGVNRLVHQQWPTSTFPLGTVVVNLVGCLLIGVLAGLVATARLPMRLHWREFVFVGVLGGFTTFSTLGLDTVTLLRAGAPGRALGAVAVQVVFGVGGAYLGLRLAERFVSR
jgi:CrcB protein